MTIIVVKMNKKCYNIFGNNDNEENDEEDVDDDDLDIEENTEKTKKNGFQKRINKLNSIFLFRKYCE